MFIREERTDDIEAIRLVNREAFTQAFGQAPEADLVDKIRESCAGLLSLVAVKDGLVVGHILFSPSQIEGRVRREGMGLAPMAVLPKHQRQGIGSLLIERGLEILRGRGCPYVIVLGHPDYYPRFGFEPASRYGMVSQWEGVPDEAFLILILDRAAMAGVSGVAKYRDEFDQAM